MFFGAANKKLLVPEVLLNYKIIDAQKGGKCLWNFLFYFVCVISPESFFYKKFKMHREKEI